ncbi:MULTISPECIES: DUF6305 family protein [unclassified Fusibacter]|uniref:DUF6305 family protein n=1 Tax=unclassified Fusibacter TaxID=2624464 RepID=UPI00101172C0|nr:MULTISPECIES: DUF6305 family protein [unclassified Fusibacter]MCK8061071.1 DUF6305 family protein [Fusibacter sp. A2]NPE20475.1 hypothetical protein [Fusibacter sp. A1]RXV63679.1 hypothetical protein DWB64_01490 [Fusibacter sp. A1]
MKKRRIATMLLLSGIMLITTVYVHLALKEKVELEKKGFEVNTLVSVGIIGQEPVVLTSFGQSADVALLKVLFEKEKVNFRYDPYVNAENLLDIKTIIAVVGASVKGLSSSGVKPEEELQRVDDMLLYANEYDLTLISVFRGGEFKKGDLTSKLISKVLSSADILIVVNEKEEVRNSIETMNTNDSYVIYVPSIPKAVKVIEGLVVD